MPEYHQSQINMFLKCPRQYMFRYLMGIRSQPKAALTLGSAFDTATTVNLTQKIETKEDLKVSEVLDAYSDDFDKRSPDTEWADDDPGEQKDMGARMIKVFQEQGAPGIVPATVQEGFRIEGDDGYARVGTMDFTDVDGFVRDTKTL